MNPLILVAILLMFMAVAYQLGRLQILRKARHFSKTPHSLPGYYGTYIALFCGVPSLLIVGLWLGIAPHIVETILLSEIPSDLKKLSPGELNLLLNDIQNIAKNSVPNRSSNPSLIAAAERYNDLRGISIAALGTFIMALCVGILSFTLKKIHPDLKARPIVESCVHFILVIASIIAIITTIGIVLSLLFESIRFFDIISPFEFLFGTTWSPQTSLREDQVGASGTFGAVPIFAGTLLITLIAMVISVPIGLMSATYMAEYASPKVRAIVKPLLEILAGIPTVVYGFFAALTIGPAFRGFGEQIGIGIASESALVTGLVMGVMIIPFVSSLSDDVINAVPQSLRDGAYALGATKSETIRKVVLPAALHGIVGAVLLAISRAIGETMIVVMAAGLAANLTANPFEAVTTVTVQIVTLLVGDQEFDSAKTLAAFALGLVLFLVTLGLNIIALIAVRRYREEYE